MEAWAAADRSRRLGSDEHAAVPARSAVPTETSSSRVCYVAVPFLQGAAALKSFLMLYRVLYADDSAALSVDG
jgi:hypothetical protein